MQFACLQKKRRKELRFSLKGVCKTIKSVKFVVPGLRKHVVKQISFRQNLQVSSLTVMNFSFAILIQTRR